MISVELESGEVLKEVQERRSRGDGRWLSRV